MPYAKQILTLTLAACFYCCQIAAQGLSADFSEPIGEEQPALLYTGGGKLMALTGKLKDGFFKLRIYDKNHTLITIRTYNSDTIREALFSTVQSLGATANEHSISYFLACKTDDQNILRRFTFSDIDGAMTTAVLCTTGARRIGISASDGLLRNSSSYFVLSKDPHSIHYAVLMFNGNEGPYTTPFELIHYDGNTHKEIQRVGYMHSFERLEYMSVQDVMVDADKSVYAVVRTGILNRGIKSQSQCILAVLRNGQLIYDTVQQAENFKDARIALNSATSKLLLVCDLAVQSSVEGDNHLYIIDTQSLRVSQSTEFNSTLIDDYRRQKALTGGRHFNAIIEKIVPLEDGGVTVIMRDKVFNDFTRLTDVGILDLDSGGKPVSGYFLPTTGKQEYFSYYYIAVGKTKYMIFNIWPKAFEHSVNWQPMKVYDDRERGDAAVYILQKDSIKREYFPGERDADLRNRAILGSGNYNEQTSEYTFVVSDNYDKKDHFNRIAWVQFK